jgi:hypothetical protein
MPVQHALLQQATTTRNDMPGLNLARVPESGPPMDGDARRADATRPAGQTLTEPVPGLPRLRGGPGQDAGVRRFEPTSDGQAAGPDEWPQRLARMVTEALAGSRPTRQVLPWTSNRARRQLQRMRPGFGDGRRPRIVRILSTCPALGVIEMSVIAGFGPRTRALALRLERLPGPPRSAGWICTDIETA